MRKRVISSTRFVVLAALNYLGGKTDTADIHKLLVKRGFAYSRHDVSVAITHLKMMKLVSAIRGLKETPTSAYTRYSITPAGDKEYVRAAEYYNRAVLIR